MSVGWTDTAVNTAGNAVFERADTLGQSTNCARVLKNLATYASLEQTVDVPNTRLAFSFDGRFRLAGGSSTCWPVASVILRYLDAGGIELGNTKLLLHNEYCTWANSDTAHLIEIETPDEWHHKTLDVAQELGDNLPGVSPAGVAKIKVQIYAYDNGT